MRIMLICFAPIRPRWFETQIFTINLMPHAIRLVFQRIRKCGHDFKVFAEGLAQINCFSGGHKRFPEIFTYPAEMFGT